MGSFSWPPTPVRNYVNATLGNYVNENPLNMGNSVNADKRFGFCSGSRVPGT
jgi:hypothetical protein